ncbi:MAG: hypothetical protein LBP75_09835 [Planctomycetota bacterium]|nr:hypothetical protein [Planctomycetota bacterium]
MPNKKTIARQLTDEELAEIDKNSKPATQKTLDSILKELEVKNAGHITFGKWSSLVSKFWGELERFCSKEYIVRQFLAFAEANGYSKECILSEFRQKDENISDEDIIYKNALRLEKDIASVYTKLKNKTQECVVEYAKRVIDLKKKVGENPEGSLPYKKMEFILSVNEKLLEVAIDDNSAGKLKEKAVAEAIKNPYRVLDILGVFFECNKYGTLEQYEDADFRQYIDFGDVEISTADEILALKVTAPHKYDELFLYNIESKKYCNAILDTVGKNFILCSRQEVIEDALNLFQNKRYASFISIASIQIEGFVTDYLREIGIDNLKRAAVTEKLHILRNRDGLSEYIYYAFDFPILRNEIAHGDIVNSVRTACELLMDIHHFVKILSGKDESRKPLYKNWLQCFVKRFHAVSSELDKAKLLISEFDCKNKNANPSTEYLTRLLNQDVNDGLIAFYDIKAGLEAIKGFAHSKDFINSILDNDLTSDVSDAVISSAHKVKKFGKVAMGKYHIEHKRKKDSL